MTNNNPRQKRHKKPALSTAGPSMNSRFNLAGRSININYLIGSFVLFLCLFFLLGWFRQNFEQVTSTDYVLKTQAQYNPYYATELLLNAHYGSSGDSDSDSDSDDSDNVTYTNEDNEDNEYEEDGEQTNAFATTLLDSDIKILLNELPDIDDIKIAEGKRPTLIINSIGTKLTDVRFQALKSWVEQGGHLITFTAKSSDNDDMQAALARLETLQAENVSSEAIANDETLKELVATLDSGNDFLNQLGIFRVTADYSAYSMNQSNQDEKDITAQLEELFDDSAQPTANAKDNSSETFVKEKLAELLDHQPLSVINSTEQNTLLVKAVGLETDSRFDTQLFQALYANSADVHRQYPDDNDSGNNNNAIKQQAQLIRNYINQSITNDSNVNNNFNNNSSGSALDSQNNTANKAKSLSNQRATYQQLIDNDLINLPDLLIAMLALSDTQLVELFAPIDNIYLDATFGHGRISVINNNNVFSNPNPNTELSDNYNSDGNDDKNSLSTSMLYEFIAPIGFYTSLLSADNAAWLLDLTRNSTQVWILPNTDIDPLPVMLWKHAKPAVLGLGFLGLVWLWSLYNRFGKMVSLPSSQTRDILRYFRQIGRFGWYQDRAHQLIQTTKYKVRLLVDEQLKSDSSYSSYVSFVEDNITHASVNQEQVQTLRVDKLHELLVARLDSKKRRLLGSIQSSSHTDDDGDEGLLLSNESFIRETIEHDRLRGALESYESDELGKKSKHDAAEFTRMTQTLWMIQWLLR